MRTTGGAKAGRAGQANGRHGLDSSAIQSVREICRDSPDEDIQAALIEHNGDVQAAVVSLLESALLLHPHMINSGSNLPIYTTNFCRSISTCGEEKEKGTKTGVKQNATCSIQA